MCESPVQLPVPATFIPPSGALGDKLAIVASFLQMRTVMEPKFRDGGFIGVHSRKWRQMLGQHHSSVLKSAKKLGLIEINPSYSDGKRCRAYTKSYRLVLNHRHSRSRLFELKTVPLKKRYLRRREYDPENLKSAGVHFSSKLSQFRIDPKAVSSRKHHGFWAQWTISKFLNREHFAKRCQYGRFHSLLTQLPRSARPFLSTTQSDSVSVVDVSACQPLIIGVLAGLPQNIVSEPSTICWSFLSDENLNANRKPDVLKWIEICEQGEFYRYFWESLRNEKEPAFTTINKPNGHRYQLDLRAISLSSFKKSCLIPLFDTVERMVGSPVFGLMKRDFPNVANFILKSKAVHHQATARLTQEFESRLMIDGIGHELINNYRDLVISSIHDALVVPTGFEDIAKGLIEVQFRRFGVNPGIKIETNLGSVASLKTLG